MVMFNRPMPTADAIQNYLRKQAYSGDYPDPVEEYRRHKESQPAEQITFDGPEDVPMDFWIEARKRFKEQSRTNKEMRRSGIMEIEGPDGSPMRYDKYGKAEEAGYDVPRTWGPIGKFLSFYSQQHLDPSGQQRQAKAERRTQAEQTKYDRGKAQDEEVWSLAKASREQAISRAEAARASLEDMAKRSEDFHDREMDEADLELRRKADSRAEASANALNEYRKKAGEAAILRTNRPSSTAGQGADPKPKDATGMLANENEELDRLKNELYQLEKAQTKNSTPGTFSTIVNKAIPFFDPFDPYSNDDVTFTDADGNPYMNVPAAEIPQAIRAKKQEIENAKTRIANLDAYLRGGDWVPNEGLKPGQREIRLDKSVGSSTNPTPDATVGYQPPPTPVGDAAWEELKRQSHMTGRQKLDIIPPDQVDDETLYSLPEEDQLLNIVLYRFQLAGFDPADVEVFETAERIVAGDIDPPGFLELDY